MLNIAQITDLHITSDLQPTNDVDVVQNFEKVLNSIASDKSIGFIAVTGDLCWKEPSSKAMKFVKEKLDATNIPYAVIPGNHDDSVIMAQTFEYDARMTSSDLYFEIELEEVMLLFLDTSKGFMEIDQLSWLLAMDTLSQKKIIVFMHHPPQKAAPFMDKHYPLQNMSEVQDYIRKCNKISGIFCGHYHTDKTVFIDQTPVFITPSTFFQLDPESIEFKHGGFQYGYRKIMWDEDTLISKVVYMEI